MTNYTWPHYHQENVWYTHTSNINFGSVLIFLSSWPKLTVTIFNEQLKVNQCNNTYRSLQKDWNCKTGKDDCWLIITDHETYCSGDISPMLCHEKTFELSSRWNQDCYHQTIGSSCWKCHLRGWKSGVERKSTQERAQNDGIFILLWSWDWETRQGSKQKPR